VLTRRCVCGCAQALVVVPPLLGHDWHLRALLSRPAGGAGAAPLPALTLAAAAGGSSSSTPAAQLLQAQWQMLAAHERLVQHNAQARVRGVRLFSRKPASIRA
jgi:hypothetical protein